MQKSSRTAKNFFPALIAGLLLVPFSATLGCGDKAENAIIDQGPAAEQEMEDYDAAIKAADAEREG